MSCLVTSVPNIADAIAHRDDEDHLAALRVKVQDLCGQFKPYEDTLHD